MEHGFFHPVDGYWQTVSTPSDDILASYPEGTVEVPIRPSVLHAWNGSEWVAPTQEELDAAAVIALEAARANMTMTFAQLLIGLVTEAWITEAEGDAWLVGTLPAPLLALIAALPVEQQFAAKAHAIRPSAVLRMDPLVVALGAAQGKTPEQIDQFFTTYSGV